LPAEGDKAKSSPQSGLPGAKTAAIKPGASKTPADEKPIEYKPLNGADGKPIDFVLQQALNQLKGLPVASNPRELMVASAGAAKAAPHAKADTKR
jgi:hypothetical protein